MEIGKKQKRILAAFGVFMGFMFLCTLISRAVYAEGLARVTAEKPRSMAISHKVEAEGVVKQGREYAVNVLSGVRVQTVYVHVGDKITPDTLLFDLDLEDLGQQIQEQELAIQKLRLQIAEQEKSREISEVKKQTENTRAMEDYVRTAQEAQENTNRAQAKAESAQADLKKKEKDKPDMTSDKDREAAQEKYDAWAAECARLKKEMEQAKADYQTAQEEVERLEEALRDSAAAGNGGALAQEDENAGGGAENGGTDEELEEAKQKEAKAKANYENAQLAYQDYLADPVAEPDYSAEDDAGKAWEAEIEAMQDAAAAAEEAAEDAKRAQENALLEAGRNIADAAAESVNESSLEINRLELSYLQTRLAAYEKLSREEGKIFSETDGIITGIQVSPGERTPDGAAVVCADLSSPLQFQVSFTKEQKKYVNQGDAAQLSFGGREEEEVRVDYIAENEADPSLYNASIFLPEGLGSIGQSGTLEAQAQSEMFSCCIPLAALHEDENHRKFVYIVGRKSGILKEESAAEAVYVKVLDLNDAYAAIEEGVIDKETEVITDATKEIQDGEVIRYD